MTALPKTFDPVEIEARWYAHWEGQGRFRPERPDAEPFTIVIPPPNVTGSLHIGHALDLTLQDILTRHARMKGKDALWVVGTDHAGIATQMVVERNLESQGVKRTDMSREVFIEHVWEWKAQSGGAITRQMRRLGASCDWANVRFTMDEGFSKAVIKTFVDMHRAGLIYRDKRLVNWDPKLGTAISDLEVETREVAGKFWHIRYPLADGGGDISVATTRPETMLADMAVAVHPDDERYRALVGRQVRLPLTGRLVPIVADEHADPELGSGAVKITPGHDFDDFEVGRRAGIEARDMLNMLDASGKIVQTADGLIPEALVGFDRFAAREQVVQMLEAEGFLTQVEDRTIATPYGDRSGVVIEPWLTDQWYVDTAKLAGPAIDAVRDGRIRVVPETWKKTWFNWLENIQPWCVSRQLWWGHRIPAWASTGYKRDGQDLIVASTPHIFVEETEAEAIVAAKAQAGDKKVVVFDSFEEGVAAFNEGEPSIFDDNVYALIRDSDVLDTWFSSALWPFATLGWPEQTDTLRRHYPNDVLISGFDIIFFWDARMAMQGIHLTGDVPWKALYLHGLVRDKAGQKMSKSKGNTVDPIGLIDRYGADALRFFMAAMESQGRDIKLDEKRIEGYRNFATKLWNAARFCQANGIGASQAIEPPAAGLPVNRWIIGETVKTVQALDLAIADLRFDESAHLIYHFTWDRFCDWYLELIKPAFAPDAPGEGADETRVVAGWVLDQILVMLHPFMPFITEELWHAMGPRPYDLILAKWPMADARAIDPEAGEEIEWLVALIQELRSARTDVGVPVAARTDIMVLTTVHAAVVPGTYPIPHDLISRFQRNRQALRKIGRLDHATFLHTGTTIDLETGASRDRTAEPEGAMSRSLGPQLVVGGATYIIPVEDVIDIGAERVRLTKAIAQAEKERDALAKRLESPGFVEKAKPEAIEKARADHVERRTEAERLSAALSRLN